ncbi:MAG TPA: glycosyltransferase family 4 protein [Pyrinomonadaceae bacterium]|nr:glycosyltransferase family 4 protein [Pyrinomonadaceae bacterium]
MRILQINSARTIGGGERHLADLANALSERGHDVSVALAPSSPFRAELSALSEQNIFSVRMRNALDIPSALKLAQFIREHKIEIVHAHLARDYPLAAFAVRKIKDARLVLTRHLERPLNNLHVFALKRVSRIIAVSKAVERALQAQKIFPPDRIRHVANGIDVEKFERAGQAIDREAIRLGLPSHARFLIGIIGELREHKGQEDFLRAAHLIASQMEDVDFLIIGEDGAPDKQYGAHLHRLVEEIGLERRVHFMGWRKDVPQLLHALDLFISSSRVEPFGLVMVEAMACGLAVVATATGGAQEIIADGETGRLVPIGDVEALAKVASALLADSYERKRLGQQARTRARERFSLARMVTATEQIYREALEMLF